MMDTLWQAIKEKLQIEIPDNQYRMWIEPLDLLESGDQELTLGCPNPFFLNWVRDKYFAAIVQAAHDLDPETPKINLRVSAPRS